jgi:hypothetical protein
MRLSKTTGNAILELVAMALWAGYTTEDCNDVDYSWGAQAWPSLIPSARATWIRNAKNLLAAVGGEA